MSHFWLLPHQPPQPKEPTLNTDKLPLTDALAYQERNPLSQAVFAVYDCKAACFNAPFLYRNVAEAIRAFVHAGAGTGPMAAHPADFTLFHLGWFDVETGLVENNEPKVGLGTLLELTPPTG